MNIYIVIGISQGIGDILFRKLSKDNLCLGITSKKEKFVNNDKVFKIDLENQNNKENYQNIITYINKFKNIKLTILFNSTIYDSYNSYSNNKSTILNINYYNQIAFIDEILNYIEYIQVKFVYFSSFEIFNKNSKIPYYKESKELYLQNFLNREKNTKKIYKVFILGGIRTESYLKNRKLTFIKKLITAKPNTASIYILKKISTDKDEIIYYPKIYRYMMIIKSLF